MIYGVFLNNSFQEDQDAKVYLAVVFKTEKIQLL